MYHKLTPEEKLRNKRGDGFLYVSVQHQSYKQLTDLYRMGMSFDTEVFFEVLIDFYLNLVHLFLVDEVINTLLFFFLKLHF